ncbi:MAG: hypothetical protein SGI74_02550 [Oligoflexia bacterium]|nr:hypothetical protein [Oligoflexia bacterium]
MGFIHSQIIDIFNKAKTQTEKAWLGGVAAMGDFSQYISQTDFVSKLNNYKSEVSKAMDAGFEAKGLIDIETNLKISPSNHRILIEGHGFFESIAEAREVGEAKGWSDSETFTTWFKSYFTDLSSPAGMPVFGKLTDDAYAFLRSFDVSEETARDLLTVNGQEAFESLVGGTLAALDYSCHGRNRIKTTSQKHLELLV